MFGFNMFWLFMSVVQQMKYRFWYVFIYSWDWYKDTFKILLFSDFNILILKQQSAAYFGIKQKVSTRHSYCVFSLKTLLYINLNPVLKCNIKEIFVYVKHWRSWLLKLMSSSSRFSRLLSLYSSPWLQVRQNYLRLQAWSRCSPHQSTLNPPQPRLRPPHRAYPLLLLFSHRSAIIINTKWLSPDFLWR